MPHFVYMLRCKGNRIYTGYAVDVQVRFEEHCSGRGAKFRQALRLEARIKKLKRPQKKLLAAGDETLESELLAGLGETLKQRASRIRKEKAKSRECKSTRKKVCAKKIQEK